MPSRPGATVNAQEILHGDPTRPGRPVMNGTTISQKARGQEDMDRRRLFGRSGSVVGRGARPPFALVVAALAVAHLGGPQASGVTASSPNPTTYVEEAKLVIDSERGLGISVDLEGDTAVVGSGIFAEFGEANVFTRADGTWAHQAQLGSGSNQFGVSVALSGDTAVVGAPGAFEFYSSAAFVYTRSGSSWVQQARLETPDDDFDSIGRSVAVSGDTAVTTISPDFWNTSTATVYSRAGTTWSQQSELVSVDAFYAYDVAVSGDTALVGAPYDDLAAGEDAGSLRVFTREGSTWTEQAPLTPSEATPFRYFGCGVSFDGKTAVVGSAAGSAYVFVNVSGTWIEQAVLTPDEASTEGSFGCGVAVDGDTAVMSFPADNDGTGSAFVFDRTGNAWHQGATLSASDGAPEDYFGSSVATSGGTVLVGAYLDDNAEGINNGSAYVFVPSTLPAIALDDVSVVEGDSGKRTARFTVRLSEPVAESVAMRVATVNGTARASIDYLPRTSFVTFAPGQSTATFDVKVKGDTTVEADETFTVRLDQPQGATVSDATGTGTILNDD